MSKINYTGDQVNRSAEAAEKACTEKHSALDKLNRDLNNENLRKKYLAACKRYERLADVAHAYSHGLPI